MAVSQSRVNRETDSDLIERGEKREDRCSSHSLLKGGEGVWFNAPLPSKYAPAWSQQKMKRQQWSCYFLATTKFAYFGRRRLKEKGSGYFTKKFYLEEKKGEMSNIHPLAFRFCSSTFRLEKNRE